MKGKKQNHDDDEEKLVINVNNNEHVMGRIVKIKIPYTSKIISVTYCQIFQAILGYIIILLYILLFLSGLPMILMTLYVYKIVLEELFWKD